MRCACRVARADPMAKPPMKLESTIVVAQTVFPNTRPHRWNHTTSKIRPEAPESRNANESACSAEIQPLGSDRDDTEITLTRPDPYVNLCSTRRRSNALVRHSLTNVGVCAD